MTTDAEIIEAMWAEIVGDDIAATCHQATITREDLRAAFAICAPAIRAQAMEQAAKRLDYLFDTANGCNGEPRIIDACFTAFMRAKEPNKEDGGASDWFNDTKPDIDNVIARMKERLLRALAPPAVAEKKPAPLQFPFPRERP